ncbi:hypothetical protein BDZ91DRAFT_732489 [Kalaharituber pfeilii]|nr:hypothetical protein BDZ91DRAFT_732489 [Kalaharituber pfeilii]
MERLGSLYSLRVSEVDEGAIGCRCLETPPGAPSFLVDSSPLYIASSSVALFLLAYDIFICLAIIDYTITVVCHSVAPSQSPPCYSEQRYCLLWKKGDLLQNK